MQQNQEEADQDPIQGIDTGALDLIPGEDRVPGHVGPDPDQGKDLDPELEDQDQGFYANFFVLFY